MHVFFLDFEIRPPRDIGHSNNKLKSKFGFCGLECSLKSAEETTLILSFILPDVLCVWFLIASIIGASPSRDDRSQL